MISKKVAPFWEHVAALRYVLLSSLVTILIGTVIAFCFYQEIFSFLNYPLNSQGQTPLKKYEVKRERIFNKGSTVLYYAIPAESSETVNFPKKVTKISALTYEIPPNQYIEFDRLIAQNHLVVLGPLDGMVASLKISFWVGFAGTSPLWLFFVLRFLTPALRPNEKRLIWPFFLLSFLFLTMGFLFAYYVTLPIANYYLQGFNQTIGENFWSLSSYVDYTIALLSANAVAFEACVILLFLVHHGILTVESLVNKRRHMIVAAFIIGAVLTPPDILTQFMLAIPLIALYELTILYARVRHKKLRLFAHVHH